MERKIHHATGGSVPLTLDATELDADPRAQPRAAGRRRAVTLRAVRDEAASTSAPERRLPLPRVIADGGPGGWVAALIAGLVFGGLTLLIPAVLDRNDAFGFLAILLGMLGAVYLGFALVDGRFREFQAEYIGVVLFTALATLALATDESAVLAAGYLGHAIWDGMHHPRGIPTAIPGWYVPLCLGFDVVVGAYVLVRFV